MENTHSDFIDGHLLMAHVKHMYLAESVENLDRLMNMAHRRIDDIYELRLSEITNEKQQEQPKQEQNQQEDVVRVRRKR